MAALLDVENLRVNYGAVLALSDVSLTVDDGEIVGLIGPNGAGKSSFIDGVTGALRSRGGRVTFRGTSLDGRLPHRIARDGLVRTFQSVELFDDLTVRENLQVAAEQPGFGGWLRDLVVPSRPRHTDDVDWALEVCGIAAIAEASPREISHGQRKLVGVARALARRPGLVLMDEPAAGLDTDESIAFGRRLRELPGHGVAVLLVEHDMELVLSVCDRLVVLDEGRVIATGSPEAVRADPAVIDAYLGASRA